VNCHHDKNNLPLLEQVLNERTLTLQIGTATKESMNSIGINHTTHRNVYRAVPMNELTLEHFESQEFEGWSIVWRDPTDAQMDIMQQVESGFTFMRNATRQSSSPFPRPRPERKTAGTIRRPGAAHGESLNRPDVLRARAAEIIRMLDQGNALWGVKNPYESIKMTIDNVVVINGHGEESKKLTARELFIKLEEAGLAKGYDEKVRAIDVVTMHLLPDFGDLLQNNDESTRQRACEAIVDELRKFLSVKNVQAARRR
jgi:hypothetical protein